MKFTKIFRKKENAKLFRKQHGINWKQVAKPRGARYSGISESGHHYYNPKTGKSYIYSMGGYWYKWLSRKKAKKRK